MTGLSLLEKNAPILVYAAKSSLHSTCHFDWCYLTDNQSVNAGCLYCLFPSCILYAQRRQRLLLSPVYSFMLKQNKEGNIRHSNIDS